MSKPGKLIAKDRRWWLKDLDARERAQRIIGVASDIWQDQAPDREQMWRNARLYGNMPILGLSPRTYRRRAPAARWNRLSLNVIKSVTDTFVALVTRDRPKVTFQTTGATWEIHRKAENLEKFNDGIFYESHIYKTAPRVLRDACLFANYGVVKPYIDDSDPKKPKIVHERVLPWEILIDAAEGFYGKPKTFYQVAWIDRLELKDRYPEYDGALESAQCDGFDDSGASTRSSSYADDLVVIVEAWRVGTKKNPGRHTIVCGEVELVDEPYTRGLDPVEFCYREDPLLGISGESLASELAGVQLEINILLDKIRRSMHLLSVGHWLVENGSEIISNQLTNEIGSIIRYSGMKPEFVCPDAVSVQIFQHLDRLYQRAFEIVGINPMSAQSQKPAGLNSGRAIMAYGDVQAARFKPNYGLYQDFFVRLARQDIALAREIGSGMPEFTSKYEGKTMWKAIKWADACLDEDEFTVKMKPTNAMADDPAAMLQMVNDLMQVPGMVSPNEAKRLLSNCPDMESYFRDVNASYDLTAQCLEDLRDGGKFRPPLPFQATEESLAQAQVFYLRCVQNHAPEKVLGPVRKWMLRCESLIPKPPPPAPPMPPPGMGGPPPVPVPQGPPGPPMQNAA